MSLKDLIVFVYYYKHCDCCKSTFCMDCGYKVSDVIETDLFGDPIFGLCISDLQEGQ